MRFLTARLPRSRVLRGVSSNVYIQGVQILSQISMVPVLASHWGLKVYGVWLLLFSVPSYLSLTDFGLARAATSDMTAFVARDEHDKAIATYQAARYATLFTNGVGLLFVAGLAFTVFYGQLEANHALVQANVPLILTILALYGAITLQNGVTAAIFTACGSYALSGYVVGTMFAAETLSAILIVLKGGSIAMVAVSYLAIRTLGTVVMNILARRMAPWLFVSRTAHLGEYVRKLLRPAAALMAMTGAQALSIQGTVAVIGLMAGPAAVPVFTTVRTMMRIAMQAILIVNHAIMPAFNVAMAVENRAKVRELMTISILVTLVCSTLVSVPSVVVGQWFIALWTHGVVHPGLALLIIMGLTTFTNMLWQPVSNLIMAINQQERFAYAYLAATALGLALCLPLARAYAATGAAVSLLCVDVVMLIWIAPLASRIGVLNLRDLPHDIRAALRRLTRRAV